MKMNEIISILLHLNMRVSTYLVRSPHLMGNTDLPVYGDTDLARDLVGCLDWLVVTLPVSPCMTLWFIYVSLHCLCFTLFSVLFCVVTNKSCSVVNLCV